MLAGWLASADVCCMKASIVMPSFNQGPYIEEAIRSVLQQDAAELELIVIDGGSTDHTRDVLERYRGRLAVCVSEPDGGQSNALNKAMHFVSGDIVGWLNSDDLYLPGTVRRVLNVFEKSNRVGVVHGDRIMIDGRGQVIGWACAKAFDPSEYGYNIYSEAAFWRHSAERATFDESLRFTMDLDWFGRLYVKGVEFHRVDDFLGAFRCHSSNKSSTLQDICAGETELCWTRLFGNEKWQIPAPSSQLRMYTSLIRHPLMLTWPYLLHRLSSTRALAR